MSFYTFALKVFHTYFIPGGRYLSPLPLFCQRLHLPSPSRHICPFESLAKGYLNLVPSISNPCPPTLVFPTHRTSARFPLSTLTLWSRSTVLLKFPSGLSECICLKEQITSTGIIICFVLSQARRIELRTSYHSNFLSCRMISSLHKSWMRLDGACVGVFCGSVSWVGRWVDGARGQQQST